MQKINQLLLLCYCCCQTFYCIAQDTLRSSLTYSAYAEFYYSYDFSKPDNHEKPNFVYNHKRHNEWNVNLAYAKANYQSSRLRGNMAMMVGNYAQYNLSAEPTWAQFVYEANVGICLSASKKWWLDVGIMPAHIGFESAVGADCWTLSRSLAAENSPYYESGAKITHTNAKQNLLLSFYVLNGWQRIQRPNFVQQPALGLQINYKTSPQLTLNYSNFIGTDQADSLNTLRFFHDIYAIYEPSAKFGATIGIDIGTQTRQNQSPALWFVPTLIVRYAVQEKTKIALRYEYYQDRDQVIINTNTNHGFETSAVSMNIDYAPIPKAIWRIEGKWYHAKDPIFKNTQTDNYSITTALSIKL